MSSRTSAPTKTTLHMGVIDLRTPQQLGWPRCLLSKQSYWSVNLHRQLQVPSRSLVTRPSTLSTLRCWQTVHASRVCVTWLPSVIIRIHGFPFASFRRRSVGLYPAGWTLGNRARDKRNGSRRFVDTPTKSGDRSYAYNTWAKDS